MFDWQRDVLPVLRATYDLMEQRNTDMLDGDELAPLITADRTKGDLYNMFRLLDKSDYARVQFAGGMTVAFIQPTEKGLQGDARLARTR